MSYSKKNILKFIVQLLHPKIEIITGDIKNDQLFFNEFVKCASVHLVLPAVYAAISKKKLQDNFDLDLIEYLKDISEINFKRNKDIIKQISFVSKLFKTNKINHVFLKGAALLVSNEYDALKERMVGDIDLLICESDISKAHKLLMSNGFYEIKENEIELTKDLKSGRHLKRLVSPNFIAAIELHNKIIERPLNYHPSTISILKNKRETIDGFWVPTRNHMWKHAILNWQYNDNGLAMNFLMLRPVLDVFYLEPKNINTIVENSSKEIKKFYSLLSLFINDYFSYSNKNKLIYSLQLDYFFIDKIVSFLGKFKLLGFFLKSRFVLFVKSSVYRNRLLKNPMVAANKIINVLTK